MQTNSTEGIANNNNIYIYNSYTIAEINPIICKALKIQINTNTCTQISIFSPRNFAIIIIDKLRLHQ